MKNVFTLIIFLAAFGCSNETELQRSIFIPDPEFPDLPAYSEWGYNTFGAYYDRQVLVSNDIEVPVKVIREGTKTSLVFTGQMGVGYHRSNTFVITIVFANFQPETYADLLTLHNTSLDLTDPSYDVIMGERVATDTAEILEGSFHFVRAQHLLVDEVSQEAILSGTFEFQALINGIPRTVSNGRFDVGVGEFNFFKY